MTDHIPGLIDEADDLIANGNFFAPCAGSFAHEKLFDLRQKIWHQAKELVDTVERRDGNFLASEDRNFARLNAAMDRCDAQLDLLDEARTRQRNADKVKSYYATGDTSMNSPSNAELRSFARGESGPSLDIALPTHEARSLSVGVGTAGGATVPTSLSTLLVQHLIANSAIRQTNVTIMETQAGENLIIPATRSHSSGVLVAEGATIGESDPAFAAVTLGAYKYDCLVQVTSELLADSGVDLTGYLATECGRALGNASGADMINGSGSGQPQGVLTAATTGVTGATTGGSFTADELIALAHSVLPAYRGRGYWMLNDSTWAAVRELKDNVGRYLLVDGIAAGEPSMLLGRPVVIDPNMPSVAAGAKSVLFGDFSSYFIRDVNVVRFELSRDFAFDHDLVTFRALLRSDGRMVDTTGALKCFVGAAS